MEYHIPVMVKECLEGLQIQPGGLYVDATFGGGGHSRAIVEMLKNGHLYGFDWDPDAEQNKEKLHQTRFTLIKTNFRFMEKYLRIHGVKKVDGILADLGVSSHQLDNGGRGFSSRIDEVLDMRMSKSGSLTGAKILNEYEEKDLQRVFSSYGEVRNARTLAQAICRSRQSYPLARVKDLMNIITNLTPRRKENKYFAQVFQALRIEVNQELKALEEMLVQTSSLIKKGGRLVILSYHSLEDRIVKNFMNTGNTSGEPDKDFYGNLLRPFTPLIRKPMTATAEEVERNNRARSAKLRIGKKG